MKSIIRIPLLLLFSLVLLFSAGCVPIPNLHTGDGLVLGQSYTLPGGQTLNTDLTVIGGSATLEQNSAVNGDVAVLGGNVSIDGKVNGDLTVMGGYVSLNDHAVIQGQVSSLGGTVQRSNQAKVEGQNTGSNRNPITTVRPPGVDVSFDPITGPLMAIFQALALAALAIVVSLFALNPMERVGQSARLQPAAVGGVGCLTLLVLVIMTLTIILIPISLIGFLVAGVAMVFGWLALGLLLGRQIAVWLKQPWSEPVNAGVGTLVLSLLSSLLNVIPCIGWIAPVLVGLAGLGAVVLTRFGTQMYPAGMPYYTPSPRPAPASGPAMVYPVSDDRIVDQRETPPSDTPPAGQPPAPYEQ